MSSLQTMKRICSKVDEMRKQRVSLENELRDLIQKDDITAILVTTERSEIKVLIEEQIQKYGKLKGYITQNLAAQDNIIKALTEANVQCANIRKTLSVTQQQWNSSVQSMMASYEAYEDLVKKAEEGKSFYQDLEKKTSSLLEKVKTISQRTEEGRTALLESEVANVTPPTPAARKSIQHNKTPDPQSVTSQKLHSLPSDMALARGPPHQYIGPYGPTPFIFPPGVANTPFSNQGIPQLTAPQQPTYGQFSGVPQPVTHMQPPSGYVVPQQLQPGPLRGITQVPSQMNPRNSPQMPNQSYMPTIWQKSPIVTYPNISGNYTEMGQTAARPVLSGQALMSGGQVQLMQSTMSQSTTAQVTPGVQYQGFPSQPGHGVMSQTPRAAFFGLNQPSSHPVPFQPPVQPQNQSQPIPTTAYWPTSGTSTQSQPGLPVQAGLLPFSKVSQLEEGMVQPFPSSPLNQFYPGQSGQNQPQALVGHSVPSIQSYQPQQRPGSLPNANNQTPLSQTFTQVPFSKPFDSHSTDNVCMPQRIAPPEGNMFFQGGTSNNLGQPVPPQNMCQQPTTQYTMFQTGNPLQKQNISPQTNSSSASVTGPVMDNPNPATLGGILTPSTAHTIPNNQIGSHMKPSPSENPSDRDLNHDFVQDQMDKLNIASHEEASYCGEDKVQ